MPCSDCTAQDFAGWQDRVDVINDRIEEIDDTISALYSERADLTTEKQQKLGLISQCNMQGGPP